MNVTVEDLGNLKRKLSVEIPLSDVQATYDDVYGKIRSNVRVKGFRPGKFPRALAEKRFKTLMEQEATRNLVPKYFDLALKEEKLSPATEPNFDNLEVDKNKPLKFDVQFEIVPEFGIPALSKFNLDPKQIKIKPKDLDERVESLRRERATLTDKGDAESAKDDTVTFDFEGSVDGEPFDGGSAKEQQHVVGSERLLPDFDKQLLGVKSGTEKSFDLVFPADYPAEHLREKTATFQITVHKVEQPELPEMNEEFFKQFGEVDSLDALKAQVKEQMTSEEERKNRQELLDKLAEQIKDAVSFDVPELLIENQLHEFEHQLSHDNPAALEDEKSLNKLKAAETDKIKQNLRLQFVLDKYAAQESIEVTQEDIQQRFMMQAYMMQQNPTELLQSPMGQRLLMQIQQDMMYNRSMEHLVDRILDGDGDSAAAKPGSKSEKSETKPKAKAASSKKPAAEKKAKAADGDKGKSADKPKAEAKSASAAKDKAAAKSPKKATAKQSKADS